METAQVERVGTDGGRSRRYQQMSAGGLWWLGSEWHKKKQAAGWTVFPVNKWPEEQKHKHHKHEPSVGAACILHLNGRLSGLKHGVSFVLRWPGLWAWQSCSMQRAERGRLSGPGGEKTKCRFVSGRSTCWIRSALISVQCEYVGFLIKV